MPTKAQRDPLTERVSKAEVMHFFNNMVPGVLMDFLESDAFKAKVQELASPKPIEPARESLLYLPESSL